MDVTNTLAIARSFVVKESNRLAFIGRVSDPEAGKGITFVNPICILVVGKGGGVIKHHCQ